jgi:hypothetical protein
MPANNPAPVRKTVDPSQIVSALGPILVPGQVTELRALDVTTATYRTPHVESGYFKDLSKMAQAAASIGQAKGVYFTPNPVNPALLARAANRIRPVGKSDPLTGEGDVIRRKRLLIDIDAKRPSGISSTDAEHETALVKAHEIRDMLRAEGWPDPVLADSGNGAHLVYAIDLPADGEGLVQRVLEALAFRFDNAQVTIDKAVFNASRIWRMYGTMACKGDSTPDRPHRMSRVIEVPTAMVAVPKELLEVLAASVPKAEPTTRRNAADRGSSFNIDE